MRPRRPHAIFLALVWASLGCGSGNGPTVFFNGPDRYGGDLWRASLGGTPGKIALPKELGDGNEYAAVHFSSPRTGVALVVDTDGRAANVLTYDPDDNAWKSVAMSTNQDVIVRYPSPGSSFVWSLLPNVPTFFARSWTDGSFVVALAITDARFGQSVWSVTSVGGAAPMERVTPLSTTSVPELDPARQMYLNLVGAPTASQLNAVAFSVSGVQPAHAAYLSFDLLTGSVEAHDVAGVSGIFGGPGFEGDDYFVAQTVPGGNPKDVDSNKVTRYCREETCSPAEGMSMQNVDGFPFTVLASSGGPLPWFKLGDLRTVDPTVRTIQLPTSSTELDIRAVLPDPQKPGTVRLIANDSDVAHKPLEFRYDPMSGLVTPLTSDLVSSVDSCYAYPTWDPSNRCGLLDLAQFTQRPQVFFAFSNP